MKPSVQIITPSKAISMLKATTIRNRPLSYGLVNSYANAMRARKWQENGEAIILDDNGNVIDGQHRLSAIVQCGIPQTLLVVSGVSPECFKTIDSGRKRTYSDHLAIAGMKDTKRLAAICGAVFTYEMKGEFANHKNPADSKLTGRQTGYDVVSETNKRMPLLIDACKVTSAWNKKVNSKLPLALVGGTYYVFAKIDKSDSDRFFDDIIEINFSGPSDPRKRLYEMCTARGRGDIMASNARNAGAIFIKAWNLFRMGEDCKFLRFYDNETHPVPL